MAKRIVIIFLILASVSLGCAQTLQTLVCFNGTNGANSQAALTLGTDGNFYGTTSQGGITNSFFPNGMGTIFTVMTNGAFTTLYSFSGSDGAYPYDLTLCSDGTFYGTTLFGGITNSTHIIGSGTVFKVTTNGTLTTLDFFNGTNGSRPNALTLDTDGNFYGTTQNGGSSGWGTIFQVTTNGTLTMLYSFTGGANGGSPQATLTLGSNGNFYGTTLYGGNITLDDGNGVGTIFRVTTNGTLTSLTSFNGTNGAFLYAPLTLGNDGNFYGTTEMGGFGFGTVFQATTNGTLTTLVSFNGTNGDESIAALTLDNDGNFYGTTLIGGSNYKDNGGNGTIFQVTTNGTLTTLVSFYGTNGMSANALTLGSDGNFYGTTRDGGITNSGFIYGMGTVFRLVIPQVVPPTLTLQFLAGYPLLSMYGTLSNTYTMEYTTNLAVPNWTPMLIVPNLSTSPFQMIDPAGVGQPARFYRAFMQ